MDTHIKYISPKWNYGSFFAISQLLGEKVIKDKPIIIHYTGVEKPWNYMNINKYSILYKNYYEEIYEKKVEIKDKTLKKIFKKKVKLLLYKFVLTKRLILYLRNKYRK